MVPTFSSMNCWLNKQSLSHRWLPYWLPYRYGNQMSSFQPTGPDNGQAAVNPDWADNGCIVGCRERAHRAAPGD